MPRTKTKLLDKVIPLPKINESRDTIEVSDQIQDQSITDSEKSLASQTSLIRRIENAKIHDNTPNVLENGDEMEASAGKNLKNKPSNNA